MAVSPAKLPRLKTIPLLFLLRSRLAVMDGADIYQIAKNCPHSRREDREIRWGAHQDSSGRRRDQHHEARTETEERNRQAIRRSTTQIGNGGVNCQRLHYHRASQPRGRGGMAYAADLRKT